MDRRSFLSIASAVAAQIGLAKVLKAQTNKSDNDLLATSNSSSASPDLVAVRGGEPAQMFDRAITALGGIEKFIKPGSKVLLKPNIGWARTPQEAANTNPELVRHLVELCLKAGAKEVKIFDHTCNQWQECYRLSGIEEAATKAGAIFLPAHSQDHYTEVDIPNGKVLKSALVHKAWLDADAIINIPILKNHGGARMTCSLKNLMGVVWDRRIYHKTDLHQCIADFATIARKPVLNVVDAYNVMMKNGPRGTGITDVAKKMAMLLSADMVAADTAAAKIMGMTANEISYIGIANKLGVGQSDLSRLKIERIAI